jgi:hypothetical protein
MHLEKNGAIDLSILFEPPFTDVNDQGLLGVFDEAACTRIIQLIEMVNGNAGMSNKGRRSCWFIIYFIIAKGKQVPSKGMTVAEERGILDLKSKTELHSEYMAEPKAFLWNHSYPCGRGRLPFFCPQIRRRR